MFIRRLTRLIVVAFAFCLSGCGTNLDEVLLQSVNATGRTFLDIALTDFANAVADSLDRQGTAPVADEDGGETDGGNTETNDGDGGADGTDGLTPQELAGEAFFASNGCMSCHCEDASGGCALEAPSIVAVDMDTLDERLRGEIAHPGGKFDISDEELAELQAYLTSLGGEGDSDAQGGSDAGDSAQGDPTAGQTVYESAGCAACHGEDAESGFAPSLVGVSADVVDDVLRGDADHAGGKPDLPDDEFADLQAYLGSL